MDRIKPALTDGSSPLTRGKPTRRSVMTMRRRLIPAHAGKTPCFPRSQRDTDAHPRSRGENTRASGASPQSAGSSPLTRGKPLRGLQRPGPQGLIPAHAGKTQGTNASRLTSSGSSPLTRGKLLGADRALGGRGLIPAHAGKTRPRNHQDQGGGAHPRSRGENFSRPKVTPLLPGSSPLTRGKPRLVGADLPLGRLIPAHAGKTSARE